MSFWQNLAHELLALTHSAQPQLSKAVQAQNAAPLRNEYNAQGQPTQIVFPGTNWGGYPAQQLAAFRAHPELPPTIPLQPLGQLHAAAAPAPLVTMPDLQGSQNPGFTPLQTGSYTQQLIPQRQFSQQQLQVGPHYNNLQYLVNQNNRYQY